MSFRVAPTVAARLAAHAADVDASDRRAAGWLVGPGALPPGTTVVVGSLRRARSCADLGADLRRAAELLPGGLEIVGAYVAGDKPEAEALVAEVKPHLEGGFAVATTRPDGSAAFHHRFSTADAIVAAAHDPLPPGWLEREYALFRCAFAARVDGPLGDDDVDADAAFAASVDAAAREAEDPSAVFLVRLPSAPSSARDDGFDAAAAAAAGKKSAGSKGNKGGHKGGNNKGNNKGGSGKNNRATDDDDGAFRAAGPDPARLVAGVGGARDASIVGDAFFPVGEASDSTDDRGTTGGGAAACVEMIALTRTGVAASHSAESLPEGAPPPAPSFAFDPVPAEDARGAADEASDDVVADASFAFAARADALAYVPRAGATVADAAAAMRAELARRLRSLAFAASPRAAADAAASSSGSSSSGGRARVCLHFAPPGVGHAVSAAYDLPRAALGDDGAVRASSAADPDAGLEATREAMHWRLGLPMDRPMLRVANAFAPVAEAYLTSTSSGAAPGSSPGSSSSSSKRLRDVHALAPGGLPKSHVGPGGSPHLVRGSYDYYHYMQDRFDDAGWGCAYRSLQTIASWFRVNGYASAPVPSHGDVQACLHAIGDKPASFVGSKQWIGAIELSYVLDELFGVSCKILTVQNGREDLPGKARELAAHFDDVGTPVMMGGGQLAYTLLGVEYDERSGECAFLILDPHYTGGEDVGKIVPRWCGWKKAEEVFAKEFYNLLMPQPPRGV